MLPVQRSRAKFCLRNSKAAGEVCFLRAKIDGVLECNGGQFNTNGETPALDLIGAEVKRGVYLRDGFKAKGGVNLQMAKIAENLDCTAGQFIGSNKTPALYANGATVTDNIGLNDGFRAEGEVNLVAAKIGGKVRSEGARPYA